MRDNHIGVRGQILILVQMLEKLMLGSKVRGPLMIRNWVSNTSVKVVGGRDSHIVVF